jgi:integrase
MPQFVMRQVGSTAIPPTPEMMDVTPAAPALPVAYTFSTLIEDCAADRSGWPGERIKTIKSTFGRLAAHIGHDDAKRVTLPELSAFKTSMLRAYEAKGGTRNTVKQLLSPVKVAFKWALANGKIDSNPAAMLTVDNVTVGTRADMTGDETATILTVAREIAEEQRWFVWLMALAGCSNKEALSCERDDFSLDGDTIVWDLRGAKTDYRERKIPLHSALAREGLWQFVQSKPGRLFIGNRIDEKANDWIKTLRVGETKISKTVYSFRHAFKTKLRTAKVPGDERNYYQGHAAPDVAATYGEHLTDTLRDYIERIPAPL